MSIEAKTLFRSLMKGAAKMPDNNIKQYIVRRAREDFTKKIADKEVAKSMFEQGLKDLAVVERVISLQQMYKARPQLLDPRVDTGLGSLDISD